MKYHLSIMLLLSAASLMAQSYFVKGPANPKPYEATAIKEMQDYLAKRIGGNKLVIGGKTPVTFQIGDTALAKEQKCLTTELEDERWVIRSVGELRPDDGVTVIWQDGRARCSVLNTVKEEEAWPPKS